jgi:hypothetical protein
VNAANQALSAREIDEVNEMLVRAIFGAIYFELDEMNAALVKHLFSFSSHIILGIAPAGSETYTRTPADYLLFLVPPIWNNPSSTLGEETKGKVH